MTKSESFNQDSESIGAAPDTLGYALANSSIAALFLDKDLNVHWFTPATTYFLALNKKNIGSPLKSISQEVKDESLLDHANETYEDLQPRDQEVETENGHWCLRQILPWRRADTDGVDGVIIIYADITNLKRDAIEVEESREKLLLLADSLPVLIAFTDDQLCFQFINAGYKEWFNLTPAQGVGTPMPLIFGDTFTSMRPHCEAAMRGQRVS